MVMVAPQVDAEEDEVSIKIKRHYLNLFTEICTEDCLDPEDELNEKMEQSLTSFIQFYPTQKGENEYTAHLYKKRPGIKRVPGFNLQKIKQILDGMDTFQEKIEWLEGFLAQLLQFRNMMLSNTASIPFTHRADYYKSLTPYLLAYPRAIKAIKRKIRQIKAEQNIEAKASVESY